MKRLNLITAAFLFLGLLFMGTKQVCAEPIDLKFSLFLPPTHHIVTNVYNPWIKELQDRTNGRVKITMYSGSTLGAPKDQYDLVVRGIADMTTHVTGYTPGRFPLTDVMSLPHRLPSGEIGARVMWELYEKHLRQEYADVKVLHVSTHEPGQLLTNKKAVNGLEDLKGMRIRVGFPVQIPILRTWGATSLSISVAETYDAMQKGMADGTWTGFSALLDFKLIEVTKSHAILNSTCPISTMVMNIKIWNSLPPDIQKVFNEMSGLKLAMKQAAEFDNRARAALEAAKAKGASIYELTPAEKKMWDEKAQPVCEAWVSDMEKKGLPGKKVYQEAVSLIEKYSK